MTADMYREYGEPYDRQVLAHCSGGWMNTLHAHGGNIIFEVLRTIRCRSSTGTLGVSALGRRGARADGQMPDGRHEPHGHHARGEKRRDGADFPVLLADGRKDIILTPGCVIRYPLDKAMLHFIRTMKDEVEASLCAGAHASAELSVSFGA